MLMSSSTIGAGLTLSPNSEMARILYVQGHRKLYNGDFTELGLERISREVPGLALNWFKRVADFYPEFMFSQLPDIEVEGNARATQAVNDVKDEWFKVLLEANRNMLRYGLGVVTTSPKDPLSFVSVDRDRHYEVVDRIGEVEEDIFVTLLGTGDATNEIANVFRYKADGTAKWEQFEYSVNNLGKQTASIPTANRAGRQALFLEHNVDLTSIFDPIKGPVGQISRAATATGKNIKRNSHPHLFGPDTMLARDESGRVSVDHEGMFLPLAQGDTTPGYLQWDSSVQTINWSYEKSESLVYQFTGLASLLFNADLKTGALSGIALRRTLIPFISKLDHYGRKSIELLRNMVLLWDANRQVIGEEFFAIQPEDVKITLYYDRIFRDAEEETPGPEQEAPLTGTGNLSD